MLYAAEQHSGRKKPLRLYETKNSRYKEGISVQEENISYSTFTPDFYL